ncbi:MAG TPA: PASTA domain-containing protein [Candidatus Coprenecus avistercoris]|uniref:PASTA domain-containing protein n=1 Tax=Candidatus Coprenecus avistercoris TaxID=2840730 RepID=A0A9D1DZL9_9BACT|nr:PASTA domain-containing protein [Candidatus Coprenecus avistercoris]
MKKFLQKPFKYSLTKNILLIIGILVVGYVIINLFLRIITRHNQELTVPDMTGMNLAEASAVAAEADLRLEVTDSVYIRGMERGAIARQNPEPGDKVKKNRRILLVINSIIPRQSTMPSLTGFSLRQARTELASNGLNIGKLIYVNDMATDNVLAQQYMGEDIEPGTRLNSGTAIDLVLGLNPADSATFIPYIIGYRYQMATELLHDNSLNIYRCEFDGTVSTYADSLEAYVYGQYPPASDSISVRRGTSVTLYLSKDVSRIPVPEEETDSTDVQL